MKAIVVHEGGGPDVLRLEEVPDPEPGDGNVVVRLEAASVNHFDLRQRETPERMFASPPFTPGVDGAGTRTDTGERVLVSGAFGTYAELIAAPPDTVRPIPDSLGTADAAALGVVYRTAWAALSAAALEAGEVLLVQAGSSGTGQAAVDIGRHLGATVYATASASKHDRLRDLPSEPLAYDDERLAGLGANVVFDQVGGPGFELSVAALAPGGRLVSPGSLEGGPVALDLGVLSRKGARIIGAGGGTTTTEDLDRLIELAGNGELKPVIDRELPLGDAADAHRLIEARSVFGKIILRT
jgi:NADPH2:quinone reductase